jgi:hypothetical protein
VTEVVSKGEGKCMCVHLSKPKQWIPLDNLTSDAIIAQLDSHKYGSVNYPKEISN